MTQALPTPRAPSIDDAAIARFVEVVFGHLDGVVPVRALGELGTPDKKPRSEFHKTEQLAAALQLLAPGAAHDGRGLYVVPATVAKPGSARASDIVQTGVLVVDLDSGDVQAARDHLARSLGEPTLEVASGGRTREGQAKLHLYWRLTEAAQGDDLERVRALREALAIKAGGDPSFKSLHQPIRIPGTIHGKNGVQSAVRIIGDYDREYELSDLEEAVETMPSLAAQSEASTETSTTKPAFSYADLTTMRVRAGCADGISRFDALSKVIGHWLRSHRSGLCSLEEAWAAVEDHNAAMIVPPWEERRLRREFDALLRRDIENHGPRPPANDDATARRAHNVTPHSEDALALEFVDRHHAQLRYVAAWGAWYRWSDGKWLRDETGYARELARQVCRDIASTVNSPSQARRVASDKSIASTLRIAAADPRVATRTADWDAHPWLLNTPNGIVDLLSGEIVPHDPGLLITQMTGAHPGSGCPLWLAFLDEITGSNQDLQSYLKRLVGYCLTGSTKEQTFAFLYGSGANGKSVFVTAIAAVMGDYAATAAIDTFMASRSERHLTEVAGLRAARLVIVPETESGRAWAEARIKSVTGGEKVRANFMRQDHFEFVPQFKLVVAGNHRPALTGIGEAMRRRLHLVPFDVTIPVNRRDRDLAQEFLEERDGILGWALEGCAEWQEKGLAPPDCVLDAVDAYFDEEDVVGRWIEDCCEVGAKRWVPTRDLFASWSAWATQAGQTPGTQKALGSALRERGFKDGKARGQRGWLGIALRTPPSAGAAQ